MTAVAEPTHPALPDTATVPAVRRGPDGRWPGGALTIAEARDWQPLQVRLRIDVPDTLAARVHHLETEALNRGYDNCFAACRATNPDRNRAALRVSVDWPGQGWLPPTATAGRLYFDGGGRHLHNAHPGDPEVAYAVDPLTLPAAWHLRRWALDAAADTHQQALRAATHTAAVTAAHDRKVRTLDGFTPTLRERQAAQWLANLLAEGRQP